MSSRPIFDPPREAQAGDNVIIRKGGFDDLRAVMRIMRSAFSGGYGEGWNRDQCAGILPMPGVQLLVAVLPGSGETLGFSLSRCVADEAELLLIAVDDDVQGRGVGKRLLDDFLDRAKEHGAQRIHLEVRDGNRAIQLYESYGFVVAGRRRQYYRGKDGARHDALTLVLGHQ